MEISFLVGLKNNLEYTMFFYENFRTQFPEEELVLVSYGSSDGTRQWLQQSQDDYLKFYISEESKTLSDTYNKAAELATKEYVAFLHNDMILGKQFVGQLKKSLKKDEISYYITVEPPVFGDDPRDWKIVQDFGFGKEDFKLAEFYSFEEKQISRKKDKKYSDKTSFFLAMSKEIMLKIGGLDPLFDPMFCEDDDFIQRLRLLGMKTKVSNEALVYHFVSKTSRFSNDYKDKTAQIEKKSRRNFVRKWHFLPNELHQKTFRTGFILKNATLDAISKCEPFAQKIFTDRLSKEYIDQEQKLTKINLSEKFCNIDEAEKMDAVIYIDCSKFNSETENEISKLSELLLNKNNRLKTAFYRVFKPHKPIVKVKNLRSFEKELIHKKLEKL